MTLTNYAPFDVDKFLNDALRTVSGHSTWTPACNAYEDDHGFWVQCALPGMDRKDIELVLEDHVLTIKGERKDESPNGDRTYFTREIDWGSFSRSFRLPDHIDANKISATYKDGVLTIELPKREEARPRRIMVE